MSVIVLPEERVRVCSGFIALNKGAPNDRLGPRSDVGDEENSWLAAVNGERADDDFERLSSVHDKNDMTVECR